jgi:uncharacterized membrane protein YfcA
MLLALLAISLIAGFLGSLLGLGGGIILVPALTLLLGVDIRHAIAASIISVIATSSGAAAAYVRDHLTNLRVAMFLELGTTSGAITGAYLAGIIHTQWLFVLFGLLLATSAAAMLWKGHAESRAEAPRSALADRLRMHGESYRVAHPALGLGLMYLAGAASGLLGIGSGALKVPAMDLAMQLPMKVSTATSNFMIGVTAAASAGLYFVRGEIDPRLAAPVAVGVLIGATAGSRMLARIESRVIRRVFIVVLLIVAAEMLVKGMA